MNLNSFIKKHPPSNTVKASQKIIDKYKSIVPASLLDVWKNHGFGTYNHGLLQIINPDEYYDTLAMWLGKRPPNYVPIALGAFGDLFYYRKLTEQDEDVCVLDPHYKKIHTIIWSIDDFFNGFLCDTEIINRNLMNELFTDTKEKHGELKPNDIYMFTPALALGGSMSSENTAIGNAQVHLSLLFQF